MILRHTFVQIQPTGSDGIWQLTIRPGANREHVVAALAALPEDAVFVEPFGNIAAVLLFIAPSSIPPR
ncbi:hypothetical protein UK99_03160 [Frankia casuarinae]|uniref:hypothetical protein n=1 Tax=Frankia TaxID=1854 RepID=UPI0004DD20FE|nr:MULTISPECIES: hypothetical protein [Frankia]KEZ37071.1 Frankia-40 domain [Frankia sp. CeD]ORT98036.1 hypothetical protein UK99_03160 [Frankia casuarinae]